MLRQNYVLVDMDAIRNNYRVLRETIPHDVSVMPVIKANAYGHGMLEVAEALSQMGATKFAVALPDEGMELRLGGIEGEILVLGATMPQAVHDCIAYGITQTVFDAETVYTLEKEAAAQQREAFVHIKLDTGMNRIGLKTDAEAKILAEALRASAHVHPTGIYTHFADADSPEKNGLNAFTRQQMACFCRLRAHFDSSIPAHVANSAAILVSTDAYFSMVRQGISLYGYPPVQTRLHFRPALRWVSEVTNVKTIAAGETIGYGRTFLAEHDMKVATVAVGYGDGYHRSLSNCGWMLIRGKRVPIVGRVCMDQTMVDVTALDEIAIGDEVVLLGRQHDEQIDAEDLAAWAGTISYEVLLAITARVPRLYEHVYDV